MRRPLALIGLVLFCTQAQAVVGSAAAFQNPRSSTDGLNPSAIYFEETFFPVYVNHNDTRSVTGQPGVATESGLGYDLRTTLGYALWGKFLLGITYNLYHLNTKRPNIVGGSNGLNETTDKGEYGPTLGLLSHNWRAMATVFLGGSQSVRTKNQDASGLTGDVTVKNSAMQGFQLSAGYAFNLSQTVQLGPSVVYRYVSYTKQSKVNQLNGAENYSDVHLNSKTVDSTLSPMISVLIRF
jgi:hypothetical protein